MIVQHTKQHLAKRIGACIIDYSIIWVFTFLFLYIFGTPNDQGGYSIHGKWAFTPIIFWLLLTAGLESGLGGTIGNSTMGIKVVPLRGIEYELTFWRSFIRHLADPIDMGFFGLVGILIIKNTEHNQRLGDLWAKTKVVKFRKSKKETENCSTYMQDS